MLCVLSLLEMLKIFFLAFLKQHLRRFRIITALRQQLSLPVLLLVFLLHKDDGL